MEKVYLVAAKLESAPFPYIVGVYDSQEKANAQLVESRLALFDTASSDIDLSIIEMSMNSTYRKVKTFVENDD